MFESKSEPLLPWHLFLRRLFRGAGTVCLLIVLSLAIGMAGYHFLEGMNFVDSLFNASMILSGMGPATELRHDDTKIFASCYAIYSGIFVIAASGLLLLPIFHRMMHKFHAPENNE